MKQINKLMLTSALVVCGFSVANAQVSNKNFIGPSIEVGIQYNKFKNSNIINSEFFSFTSADNNTETLTRVSLNYGFPVAERTVLTLGASFTNGENNFNSSTDQEVGMKYDNMYSLYIAPTYAVTDSTAAFAKVSYNQVDASGSSLWGGSYDSNKKNISGIGIGAGIMTFITKDIFLKAEVERINYGSNTHILQSGSDTNNLSLKSVATNTTISIGMKF